jgi:hypothetical protein
MWMFPSLRRRQSLHLEQPVQDQQTSTQTI